jgi:RNA polymerase sigma factor (sigma-70 family)
MKPFDLLNCVIGIRGDDVESDLLHTDNFVTKILEKYADTVWRLCLVYMRNKADAEDVFQNVFIKLYQQWPTFNGEAHVKAWLITVTTNECKNQLKSFWRKNVIAIAQVVSPIEHDNNKEVVKVVMQLPTKYRDVLYLHYFEGYKANELVTILESNESTIKTRLKRGRELLKKVLVEGGYQYE